MLIANKDKHASGNNMLTSTKLSTFLFAISVFVDTPGPVDIIILVKLL